MQSMTASAKEDVHEAAVNAYCIEFSSSSLDALLDYYYYRGLVVWLFKLDAQRRAAPQRARALCARARLSLSLCLAHGPCRLPATARPTRPGN